MSIDDRSADVVFLTWRARRARTPARDVCLLLIPCHMDQNMDFIAIELRRLNRISKGIRLSVPNTNCKNKWSTLEVIPCFFCWVNLVQGGWRWLFISFVGTTLMKREFNSSIITLVSTRDVRVCKWTIFVKYFINEH